MQTPQEYGAELSRLKEVQKQNFERALAGAVGAIQALKKGEQHEKICSTVDRTTQRYRREHCYQTSIRPELPRIVVTKPVSDTFGDYHNRIHGAGWSEKQE